jgi:acyl-CoA synthetase (AMP-forming)/AMP-acid ligase II
MDYSPGFVLFRDIYVKNPLLDPLDKITPSGTDVAFVVPANGQWQGITQQDAVSAAQAFASGVGLTRDDRVSVNLGLSTLTGKVAGVLGVMSNLSVIIIPSQTFSSAKTIATLDKEVVTTLLVTPDQLQAILADPTLPTKKFERLEKLIVVSDDGRVPSADVLTKAKGAWGLRDIRVAVGSVSAAPFLVSGSGDPTKLNAVSNTQVKVVDDQGKEVNKGVSGHLVVKGPAATSTRWVRGEAQALGEWRDSGLRGATSADGTVTVG